MLMRFNVMQMAVFLLNECRFRGCGMNFQTLGDLIQHIEDTHIGIHFRLTGYNVYMYDRINIITCEYVVYKTQ